MELTPPVAYRMSLTAAEVEELLLSIYTKIPTDTIRTSLDNPDDLTIPTTKAVADVIAVINADLEQLGGLALLDELDLGSSATVGVLSISKGGTGGGSVELAQQNLGIVVEAAIQAMIDASIPEIQSVDLGSAQATGVLPLSKGGTGATGASQARVNLGVWSSDQSEQVKGNAFESLRRSYAEAGYNLVAGSFEVGGTLVNVNDVLLQESTGKAFSGPAGPVSAGTNPVSGGFVDRSDSLVDSTKVKTKYGTLNVFTDLTAYAPSVGILTTNTPSQNTAALNSISAVGGISLYIPAGTFQFDIFATTGLVEVFGAGKTLTVVETTGSTSAAMVQSGPIKHSGIWFKSINPSKDSARINISNYSIFEDCKVSDFVHSVPAPNAWGMYIDKVKGARLTRVEFDNNSQADIAVVEGVTDLVVDGCWHTSGNLHINVEPNNGVLPISGVLLRNMQINKSSLLCNDLNYATDDAVVVQGCVIEQLRYDGLGVTFIGTKINSFFNQADGANRIYGANITGIKVGAKELVPDTSFADVGDTSVNIAWTLLASTTPAINRYNRTLEGDLTVCVNGVPQATQLKSQPIPCGGGKPYLFTVSRKLEAGGSRPDITRVSFKDSGGAIIIEYKLARKLFSDRFDRHQHIIVSPSNAVSMEILISGSDTASVFQSVSYRYFSVREIDGQGIGVDSCVIGDIQFPKRVEIKFTKASIDSLQRNHAPLPTGTEIEFAYAAGAARLAKVTAQASDNSGKFGTLQVIANYP